MVIDFRARPPYRGFLDLHLFRQYREAPTVEGTGADSPLVVGRVDPPSFRDQRMETFLAEMAAAGIGWAVVPGTKARPTYGSVSNDDVHRLTREYPDRFVPLAGIDPREANPVAEVERCLGDLGFKGITVNPGWLDPPMYEDDPALFPVYERCQALGGLLCVNKSMFMGPDFSWGRPEPLHRVARAFPRMPIVVIHGGFPYVLETLALAFACPSVWISPDIYGFVPDTPGAHEFVRAAHYFLGERLLFASAYPMWPMGQAVECFRAMGFKPDVLDAALRRNPARLLGLDA